MTGSPERVEDALFLQARGVVGVEFEEWIANLTAILRSTDRGPTCLTLLRQLYVLTAATKYRRNLNSDAYRLLISIVLEPEQGSSKVRLLAASVLQELSPSKYIKIENFNPPVERTNIPYFLPVMLAQTNVRDKLSQLTPKIVEWLIQPGHEDELALAALCTLYSLCSHPRALEHVEVDQLRSISLQIATWLKHASTNSLPAPTTGISIFGGGGKKQLLPVKEIDGSPSQGIFTILSLGGYYSTDQLLNVSAFSILRRWLLTTITSGGGPAPSPSASLSATPTPDYESRSSSHMSSTPSLSSSYSLPPQISSPLAPFLVSSGGGSSLTSSLISRGSGRSRQSLKEVAVQYCLRVIEQCERKPTKDEDYRLINSCLYECISILNLLCSLSRSLVHTVFPKMRILCSRVMEDPVSNSRLLLILLKFFVDHGESEMYDLDSIIDLFFGKVLSLEFDNPALAYEVISYLTDNMERLHEDTNIFTKFFPNILKILAWSPVTFVAEFLQLLPAFITENTASEVLHSILDLPCLAATLQAKFILSSHQSSPELSINPRYSKCLAAFQDGTFKFMFRHFLRAENGRGDTIDRLASLHHLLLDFVDHERVRSVARVAPLMMSVFFKTIFYGGKATVNTQLATVLLERIVLLYDIHPFVSQARKIMAKQLLIIYELHPYLVVDNHRDLLDFLGNIRTLTAGGEHCYMHLVWIVGEYCHVGYDSRCTSTLLNQFFLTLESIAYELSINFNKKENFSIRLLMVLMSSLAKLASRHQDLITRALLCLNKIVQLSSDTTRDQDTHQILLNRANELVNVLKIPSLASAILNPPTQKYGGDQMKRQIDIAHLLQATSNHLNVK